MKQTLDESILAALRQPNYQPLKAKALARKLGVLDTDYGAFREAIRGLVRKGQVELTAKHAIRLSGLRGELVGVYRSIRGGGGFVRPKVGQGKPAGDIFIKAPYARDAATGDVVLVKMRKRSKAEGPKPPVGRALEGEIVEVIERATDKFVGSYFTREGEGFVRVDGNVFHEDIYVGDANAKGARDGDKVVFEMLRFPSPQLTGEGVITEILGPRGDPGVDLLSVIRQFNLPDEFPEEVNAEAREQARLFENQGVGPDRLDLTGQTIVTIDPVDARDFDDAISIERDEKGFWQLGVHIADVSTFVQKDTDLDREARKRGTSVYLPGKVLPMLPELISNGLASLQEGRIRFTKSVLIEFDPHGNITETRFANSAIKVTKRFTYETVMEFFEKPEEFQGKLPAKVRGVLELMRELASMLRERRRKRGFIELQMPAPKLQYDADGKIVGAVYTVDDESHRVIEEFMLTANEAVAQKLEDENIKFLRRVHELPDPLKLKAFAEFVKSLGLVMDDYQSRFELQRILKKVVDTPQRHAVHYALLRSLKMAVYSPDEEGHYALASDTYCHFTSPIRRYPDLLIHRQMDQLIRTGKAGSTVSELVVLGEHCSFTERRAEKAERELVKIKLLSYLTQRVGDEMPMVITGVEEYGFYAQGTDFPAEGLVHVRTLTDDFYAYESATHSLVGRQRGKRFRLGDRVKCVIWKVDEQQRQLDLRLTEESMNAPPTKRQRPPKEKKEKKEKAAKPKRKAATRKAKRKRK